MKSSKFHISNILLELIFIGSISLTCAKPDSRALLRRVKSQNVRLQHDLTATNSMEPMFSRCCVLGTTWAEEKKECEVGVAPTVSGIPGEFQTPCLVTASICCLRVARNAMCELGKVEAMHGNDCLRSAMPGGEYQKDCCDSCKLGLMTGARGESCSFNHFSFEYPWDEGFADCCQVGKLSIDDEDLPDVIGDNEVHDGRCVINNPCAHICKDTGVAIECSCNPGYQLGTDEKSCHDLNECTTGLHLCDSDSQQCVNTDGSYFCLNEDGTRDHPRLRTQFSSLEVGKTTFSPPHNYPPAGPPSSLCPTGYNYNEKTRNCDDVNECKLYLDNCNRDTYNCQNTIGSFMCIERRSSKCPPGYKLDPSLVSCVDINECSEGLDYCNHEREFCVNTIGGYECQPRATSQCPAGYKYSSILLSCEDVNECHENLHNCDLSKEQCRNTVGGYECDQLCENGFRFSDNLRQCLDVDECEEGTHACESRSQDCVNTPGSYNCYPKRVASCPAGYKQSPQSGRCEDVDECLENLDTCDKLTETCLNRDGYYECVIKAVDDIDCESGYRFDEHRKECADVDECYENIHDCDLNQSVCINTQGGFRCQILPCPIGLRMSHITRKCEDVNECLEELDSCDRQTQICINTAGSYHCQNADCPEGFQANLASRVCEDINECEIGTHNCTHSNQQCVNTMGGFECKYSTHGPCRHGERYNAESRQCEDINECLEGTHNCDTSKQVCYNTVGSFTCRALICPNGYRPNLLARTCIDVNECEENIHNCTSSQECINRIGGFYCQTAIPRDCPLGYRYNTHVRNCEDIDECQENQHNCPGTHNCVNIPGNFVCHAICQEGFANDPNDPRQCKDIDECSEQLHSCNQATETCVNAVGSYRCVFNQPDCPRGYHLDPQQRICVDINECEENSHNCHTNQICINSQGSFSCQSASFDQCGVGFRYNSASGSCVDVDECAEGLHNCNPDDECRNHHGGFTCVARQFPAKENKLAPPCYPGFHYNPRSDSCVDVDECYQRIHNCNLHTETCVNTEGSFWCKAKRKPPRRNHNNNNNHNQQCLPGFELDTQSRLCVDVNECQAGSHSCTPSQRCDNTIGSFTCIRTTGCGTGYTLNAASNKCEDDDECELGLHDCGVLYECRNTLGSYRCNRKTCLPGFRLESKGTCVPVVCNAGFEVDSKGECADINECFKDNACPLHHACINTIGSFKCDLRNICGEGFEVDLVSGRCGDMNECTLGTHDCRTGQTCVNRPGGYACQCQAGYIMGSRRECEDIDECLRYGHICTENGHCVNTPGSYMCQCKKGFKQTEEGKTCIDDDECEQAFICHQKCINTWGSYQCACNQGFTLSADSRSCQDIDECSLWRGRGHLCIGICVNEPGSYSCSCPDGYKLGADKRTCHDINECSQPNACRREDEICLNTKGGYRCNDIVCPSNYVKDTEHKNRCKRESVTCERGDNDCLRAPLSYSYNYITFVSNLRIPQSGHIDLFTMRGPLWTSTTVQFTLELASARAPTGVTAATRNYFDLRRTAFNQAVVAIIKSIPGPQEIELDLVMKIFSNGLYGGQAVAKIFIFVSEYDF